MAKADRVDFTGPFFDRDPAKTVRENIKAMLDAMADEAERDLQGQLRMRSETLPETVEGYTTSTRTGKRWELSMAVNSLTTGMSKELAIATKAKLYGRRMGESGTTVGIEAQYRPFKKTASAMRRSRHVVAANLVEGLE